MLVWPLMGREEREVRYTVPVNLGLDAKVRRRIETGGFSTVAEYVRGLMRADVEEAAQRRLEEKLLDALGEEHYAETAPEFIAKRRARGRNVRMGARRVIEESAEEKPERVLETLRSHKRELRKKGVVHAAVFGSTVRGEATPSSDVDILVDIDPKRTDFSVFDFVALAQYIQGIIPGADVVERKALKPRIRNRVLGEAVDAF